MQRNDERAFPADLTAPAAARRFSVDHLQPWLGADQAGSAVADDVALIVSELVTNSVTAQATVVVVGLAVEGEHLRIAVTDDAPGFPQVQSPQAQATGGRGLSIIEHLVTRWGTAPTDNGKQVWAEVALPPRSSG